LGGIHLTPELGPLQRTGRRGEGRQDSRPWSRTNEEEAGDLGHGGRGKTPEANIRRDKAGNRHEGKKKHIAGNLSHYPHEGGGGRKTRSFNERDREKRLHSNEGGAPRKSYFFQKQRKEEKGKTGGDVTGSYIDLNCAEKKRGGRWRRRSEKYKEERRKILAGRRPLQAAMRDPT